MAMAMAMETFDKELMACAMMTMPPPTLDLETVAMRKPPCKRDAANALGTRGAPRTPAHAAHVHARVGGAATALPDRTVATDNLRRP